MRLAYADPPYPGKAHLYPENTEVDHAELIQRLCEYDGWALSTDETNLQYVLGLCPPGVRVLAWCRTNAPPRPLPVYHSWEPVIVSPAHRPDAEHVRSYLVSAAPIGRAQVDELKGQKTAEFCGWVLRAMGAQPDDDLDDVFPGTGIMTRTFEALSRQTRIRVYVPESQRCVKERINYVRASHDPLPGLEAAPAARTDRVPAPVRG